MKDKKLIAFDLYDTCLHFTVPDDQLSYKQLFREVGLQQYRKEMKEILLTSQRDIEDIISHFCPNGKFHDAMQRYEENYQNEIASIQLFPETKDTLSALKDRGYKIAVVSNISVPYTKALYTLLPHTFHYEILSCEVGVSKPDKKIFDIIKNISGNSAEEIVMVGDSISSDIKGAKNANIDPIHIDRESRGIQQHKGYISISALNQLLEIL